VEERNLFRSEAAHCGGEQEEWISNPQFNTKNGKTRVGQRKRKGDKQKLLRHPQSGQAGAFNREVTLQHEQERPPANGVAHRKAEYLRKVYVRRGKKVVMYIVTKTA